METWYRIKEHDKTTWQNNKGMKNRENNNNQNHSWLIRSHNVTQPKIIHPKFLHLIDTVQHPHHSFRKTISFHIHPYVLLTNHENNFPLTISKSTFHSFFKNFTFHNHIHRPVHPSRPKNHPLPSQQKPYTHTPKTQTSHPPITNSNSCTLLPKLTPPKQMPATIPQHPHWTMLNSRSPRLERFQISILVMHNTSNFQTVMKDLNYLEKHLGLRYSLERLTEVFWYAKKATLNRYRGSLARGRDGDFRENEFR